MTNTVLILKKLRTASIQFMIATTQKSGTQHAKKSLQTGLKKHKMSRSASLK
jgi:hypothetical protein